MKHNKVLLASLIVFSLFSCNQNSKIEKSEPEKKIENNNTDTILAEDIVLTKQFSETNLKIKINYSGTFEDNLEVIKVTNDTIYLFTPSIGELKSIKPLNANDEYTISQRYKSLLHIGYDGKTFLIDNWKIHYSPWLEIWDDASGSNIKQYSYFDKEYFPNYTDEELISGIKLNAQNFSEYWADFFIKKIKNNEEEELDLSPSIEETQFKITDKNGKQLIVIVEHQVGC